MAEDTQKFHLWIAHSSDRLLVSPRKIRARGAILYSHWSNVTELQPQADERISKTIAGLCATLALFSVLLGFGASVQITALLSSFIITVIILRHATRTIPGKISRPPRTSNYRVIDTRAEREKFLEAMKLAWRASETLPSLTQMIDTNQSSELMARTLWDAAKLLRHRSELVAILEKICGHDTTLLPDSSHAAKHLSVQRELTRKSISAIDADIANLLSHLESAATAGESFIQERKIKRAASQIEEELLSVGLYISDTNTTSSEQLAIDTKNVLDAYRELNELYGNLQ